MQPAMNRARPTTSEFLQELRNHFNAKSDYALEDHTGWARQQISRYRQNKQTFNDETILKVAKWLAYEPTFISACMSAQRANTNEARATWEWAAKKIMTAITKAERKKKYAGTIAAVVVGVLLGAEHGAQLIEYASAAAPSLYIMSNAAAAALAALALVRVFLTVKSPSRA
jgi:hypothetical protein